MAQVSIPSREADQAQHTLDTLVDTFGLEGVLRLLSDVCYDKASHLCENWQDTRSGKAWAANGELVYELAYKAATT